MWKMTPANIQGHEIPLHQTAEPETNQPFPVKRLDGGVKRLGEIPFSGGLHCEVWIGIWEEGGGEKVGLSHSTFYSADLACSRWP